MEFGRNGDKFGNSHLRKQATVTMEASLETNQLAL